MCCYVTVKLPAGNGRRSRPGTPKAPAAQGDRGSVEGGVSRTLGSRRGARPAGSGDGGSGGRREYRRRWTGEARPRHGPSPRGPPERGRASRGTPRAEEHTSELQSRENLVCRLLLEKKNNKHEQ